MKVFRNINISLILGWISVFLLNVRIASTEPFLALALAFMDSAQFNGNISGTLADGVNLFPERHHKHQHHLQIPMSPCPYTPNDAVDLLGGIDKMVNSFYVENVEKIRNIDGSFGPRVLQGQLNYFLEAQDTKLSPKQKLFFGHLRETSRNLSVRVLEQALQADSRPNKKKGIQTFLQNTHIWDGLRSWRDSNEISKHLDEFKDIGKEEEVIEADMNFDCLSRLVEDCIVSPICEDAYLRDIHSQYMLTHQVLFLQFAEKRSCAIAHPDEAFLDRLCSKTFLEAEFLASHNYPTRFIDLFAEQVGLCALMGYPNFMRADWLQEILSWKEGSISGCMPDLYGSMKTSDINVHVQVAVGRGKDGEGQEESCLVHLTSVSLLALSMHLRYMVDVCEPNLFDGYFSMAS